MGRQRQDIGKLGEDKACAYLQEHGHTVMERNWRSGSLEIDIISRDGDGALHFVEVKSRIAPVSASPEDNVTPLKQRRVSTAAQNYLNAHPQGDVEVFFDVVGVVFDGFDVTVEWFPQAWIPTFV